MSAPVLLVTGGSRGIGAATAKLAARKGYDVALSYVRDEQARRKSRRKSAPLVDAPQPFART